LGLGRMVTLTSGKTLSRWMLGTAMLALLALGIAGCRVVGGTATSDTPVAAATPTLPPVMRIVTPTPAPAGTPSSVPPAPAATRPPAQPANSTYIVQAGDTLYVIAAKLNVSVQALATANGITNPSSIQVGQVLKVPTPTPSKP